MAYLDKDSGAPPRAGARCKYGGLCLDNFSARGTEIYVRAGPSISTFYHADPSSTKNSNGLLTT